MPSSASHQHPAALTQYAVSVHWSRLPDARRCHGYPPRIHPLPRHYFQVAREGGGGTLVCFTSYFVFSIAVLPHSPGVVYYHLLLRRETRIPGVAPFSFRIGIWDLFVHRGQKSYTPTAFGKLWTTPGVRCTISTMTIMRGWPGFRLFHFPWFPSLYTRTTAVYLLKGS